jgi:hypothetical protein
MRWLLGILLGLILTAALPLFAGVIAIFDRTISVEEEMLLAVALVTFCLLGVLIFRPAAPPRSRFPRRGAKEEEE